MDRIDLCVEVPKVEYVHLSSRVGGETSSSVRERVCRARDVQCMRFVGSERITNAEMRNTDVDRHCALDSNAHDLLGRAVHQMSLSARSYYRVLKIARTIADLDGAECIALEHVAESLQYRHKRLI